MPKKPVKRGAAPRRAMPASTSRNAMSSRRQETRQALRNEHTVDLSALHQQRREATRQAMAAHQSSLKNVRASMASDLNRARPRGSATLDDSPLFEDLFNDGTAAPWVNSSGLGQTPVIGDGYLETPVEDLNGNGYALDLTGVGASIGGEYRIVASIALIDEAAGRLCRASLSSFRGGTENNLGQVLTAGPQSLDIDHTFVMDAASTWFNVRELTGAPHTSRSQIFAPFKLYEVTPP